MITLTPANLHFNDVYEAIMMRSRKRLFCGGHGLYRGSYSVGVPSFMARICYRRAGALERKVGS